MSSSLRPLSVTISTPTKKPSSASSSESSSFISEEPQETCELKRTPSSLLPEKMDRSHSTLRSRIKARNFRVSFDRALAFKVFKWILILFNGLFILAILVGLFVYFSEFREKNSYKLESDTGEGFSSDPNLRPSGSSSGPKYAWIMAMLVFAMLLSIPCLGFIGAIKEHVCLLILYGVIFVVEAIVILIFRSFWFLVPALVASAAMGLVVLIRNGGAHEEEEKKSSPSKSGLNWCLDKV